MNKELRLLPLSYIKISVRYSRSCLLKGIVNFKLIDMKIKLVVKNYSLNESFDYGRGSKNVMS